MPKKNDRLLLTTARIEAAMRHSELADRERLMLHAYVHFEALHGGACGVPGVCWPTDGELGAYLGRSDITIRRARRRLADPGVIGSAPFIAIRYVGPFGKLPNGETTWHGANVVTLLEIATPAAAPATRELADATSELAKLEARLARARQKVAALAAAAAEERTAAAAVANDVFPGSTHNAPCVSTPGWSLLREAFAGRGGDSPRKAA
jgi:hypothetical protein